MTYTLHLGDCLDIMPTLEAESVDAVITDPPYGTTACTWDSVIPFALMWAGIDHVIKPRSAVVLFGSQPFTSALVMSRPNWFRDEWIWRKNRGGDVFNAKLRPLKLHESIVVFSSAMCNYHPQGLRMAIKLRSHRKSGSVFYADRDKPAYVQEFQGYPTTILEYAITENMHPTQKPIDLLRYLIRTYTNPGDTVLDFTMGSGTTGVACMMEGRNFIGIEIDPGYFAIAEKRIADAAAQPRLIPDEPTLRPQTVSLFEAESAE